MAIIYYTLIAIAKIIAMATQIFMFLFIARAVLSWVNPDPYNTLVRFLYSCTDPVLNKIRRAIPTQVGMLDFSIIIVIFILVLIQEVVPQSIIHYASSLMR